MNSSQGLGGEGLKHKGFMWLMRRVDFLVPLYHMYVGMNKCHVRGGGDGYVVEQMKVRLRMITNVGTNNFTQG